MACLEGGDRGIHTGLRLQNRRPVRESFGSGPRNPRVADDGRLRGLPDWLPELSAGLLFANMPITSP